MQTASVHAETKKNEEHARNQEDSPDILWLADRLKQQWIRLVGFPLLAGVIALALSFLIDNVYTSTTTILPPQQQQSAAASALSSLGSLAGLAGSAGGSLKSPADQYASLLQSANVEGRIIDKFALMQVYEAKLRSIARKRLQGNVRVTVGKKDGLISVEVDDTSPQRAADIANQYVTELRRLTGELALTEAQLRRAFFSKELTRARSMLAQAQIGLQGSGFDAGAIKAEPKAAAESYARMRAEATAASVKLQVMRRVLTENAPELQQQLGLVSALQQQLTALESSANKVTPKDADYIGRYREYKYQETLYELFAKQYEMARVDESREGALIQIVDLATPADLKSRPGRSLIAIGVTLAVLVLYVLGIYLGECYRRLRKERRPTH